MLVTPAASITAPLIEDTVVRLDGEDIPVGVALTRCTRIYNLMGIPAVSLPCGLSRDRLPMAIQIAARPFDEKSVLRVAHAYETAVGAFPWPPFSNRLVVSMRPMTPAHAVRAVRITTRFHLTHGAPVHLGSPEAIGVRDLDRPELGDPVTVLPGEIPVFWACGVTSALAATSAALPLVITHSPGHMFVSDLKDEDMTVR